MADLVSVIMPAHNAEAFIGQTINSVRAQTYPHWEVLVVDDNSSDGTCALVERAAVDDPRIRLFRMDENRGAGFCRNTAIRNARGRFIAFLDCDDLWLPEKLERQLEFMAERNTVFSYSAYRLMDEDGTERNAVITVPPTVTYEALLRTCVIGCLTAVYDSAALGKMYMPLLPKGQDYALWLDILKKCGTAYGYPEPLAVYRIRGGSISRNKFKKSYYQWQVYRKHQRLALWKSAYCFVHYAFFGFIKNYLK